MPNQVFQAVRVEERGLAEVQPQALALPMKVLQAVQTRMYEGAEAEVLDKWGLLERQVAMVVTDLLTYFAQALLKLVQAEAVVVFILQAAVQDLVGWVEAETQERLLLQ
jgi:hypothetical protein